jgi:hypothetical protein
MLRPLILPQASRDKFCYDSARFLPGGGIGELGAAAISTLNELAT